jgi:hypothetical protein
VEYARKACTARAKPFFEELVQLAKGLILLGRLEEAEESLRKVEDSYPDQRKGIVVGMRCWLLNSKGHYRDALALSEQMENQASVHYKNVRRHALEGLLKNPSLSDKDRGRYRSELSQIASGAGLMAEMLSFAQEVDLTLLLEDHP